MNKKILLLITFLIAILFVSFLIVFSSDNTDDINKNLESKFDESGEIIDEANIDDKIVKKESFLEPKPISIPEFIKKNKTNKILTMNFYVNVLQVNKKSSFTILLKNNSEKEFRTAFNPSCESIITMHFFQNEIKIPTPELKCDSTVNEKEFFIPAGEIASFSFENKIKLKTGELTIILETKENIQEYSTIIK